jgi:hypothetical protein
MTAKVERPLISWALAGARARAVTAVHGAVAIFTVAAGVLGLIRGSRLRLGLESWIDVHVLFGLLLFGLLIARYQWKVQHAPPLLPDDIRELSRHLSRIAYLLLYLVVGLRQIAGIVTSLWQGGPVDFNLFDARFRSGPDYVGFNPKDDFQLFLACGLSALIFIRICVFRLGVGLADRAEPAKTRDLRSF